MSNRRAQRLFRSSSDPTASCGAPKIVAEFEEPIRLGGWATRQWVVVHSMTIVQVDDDGTIWVSGLGGTQSEEHIKKLEEGWDSEEEVGYDIWRKSDMTSTPRQNLEGLYDEDDLIDVDE